MKPIFIALLITLFGFAMGLKNRECLNINSLNLLVKYFFILAVCGMIPLSYGYCFGTAKGYTYHSSSNKCTELSIKCAGRRNFFYTLAACESKCKE